jgi:hypothetical protein
MPVCRTFDDAVKQLAKTTRKRARQLQEGGEALDGWTKPATEEDTEEDVRREVIIQNRRST